MTGGLIKMKKIAEVPTQRAVEKFFIPEDTPIKTAMRRMGEAGERILFVVNADQQLIGSLTDGDIRRWVLANGDLMVDISRIYNRQPLYVKEHYDMERVKELMIKSKITGIPVIGPDELISDVLIWNAVFSGKKTAREERIDVPVMIMAGGKGTRLDPFTKILPKPLIPIGEKTILELIMDKFHDYGVQSFYISTNHKSRLIKAYFEERESPYTIKFVEETKPLGTIGSLSLIREEVHDSIIVSNCDIIIECDYHEFLEHHRMKGYDLTLVGSFRHFKIPYGICKIADGGALLGIEEKPEYDYLINTGMYILKKDVLNLIPDNEHFNITDLIKKIKDSRGKVGVFPIDEKSWIDIGQWDEYQKAVRHLGGEA